jgi:hypothetical protein
MKTVEFDIGNTVICDSGGNNKVTISGGDAAEVDRMAADYKDHLGIEK